MFFNNFSPFLVKITTMFLVQLSGMRLIYYLAHISCRGYVSYRDMWFIYYRVTFTQVIRGMFSITLIHGSNLSWSLYLSYQVRSPMTCIGCVLWSLNGEKYATIMEARIVCSHFNPLNFPAHYLYFSDKVEMEARQQTYYHNEERQ